MRVDGAGMAGRAVEGSSGGSAGPGAAALVEKTPPGLQPGGGSRLTASEEHLSGLFWSGMELDRQLQQRGRRRGAPRGEGPEEGALDGFTDKIAA